MAAVTCLFIISLALFEVNCYIPCSTFPLMKIADCRNRGLTDSTALELIFILREYDTVHMENNHITCLEFAPQKTVIILNNPVRCDGGCKFPPNIVTGCRKPVATTAVSTEKEDLKVSGDDDKLPNYTWLTARPAEKVSTTRTTTTTTTKQLQSSTLPFKYTTKFKGTSVIDHSTYLTSTVKEEPVLTTTDTWMTAEPPILPSYQAKECVIWHVAETYIMIFLGFIAGILTTVLTACIRLKFFGKYNSDNRL